MTRRMRVKKQKSVQSAGDITLADFANNESPRTRIAKINRSQTTATGKVDASIPDATDELSSSAEEDPTDGQELVQAKVKTRKMRSSRRRTADDDGHVYAQHHLDIWFQISEHIAPEDVMNFALICQQTAYVCRTAKFWRHLYKRVYDEDVVLPVRLQPNCMVRLCGLRTCTIRSLFYLYPPLMSRLAIAEQQNIMRLLRRECLSAWTVHVKDSWYYCFKMKEHLIPGSRLALSESTRRENVFAKVSKDIYHNPDEGCKLMVVKMSTLRPLPQLFGHQSYLDTVKHSLSTGCTEYKLQMSFVGSGRECLSTVVYDPVQEIRVLDWWTPAYQSYCL